MGQTERTILPTCRLESVLQGRNDLTFTTAAESMMQLELSYTAGGKIIQPTGNEFLVKLNIYFLQPLKLPIRNYLSEM